MMNDYRCRTLIYAYRAINELDKQNKELMKKLQSLESENRGLKRTVQEMQSQMKTERAMNK